MRGNKNQDMEERLKKKYPNVRIISKGSVCDNFGCGGNKYYQHFWVENTMSDEKV